jgi:cysteine-rich repeat protein
MLRIFFLALLLLAPALVPAATLPPGFQETTVASGLSAPTSVAFASDGRMFVAEKNGRIQVYDAPGDPTPTLFADLRTNVNDSGDRGLLAIALHPDFPDPPYVYVLYTLDAVIGGTPPQWRDQCPDPVNLGCPVGGRVSRLTAAGNVVSGSEHVLVENWCQQSNSHSIGDLAFGEDGALFVSAGDGANFVHVDYGQFGNPPNPCGDPPGGVGGSQKPPSAEGGALRSQDLRTLGDPVGYDGTILRLDPITGAAFPDNALVGGGVLEDDRIVAFGFRNPFRLAPRPGTTELWIGEVGWADFEEIDVLPDPRAAVRNYGWPCYEGFLPQPGYDGANLALCESLYSAPGSVVDPVFAYRRGEHVVPGDACGSGGSAISALTFYDGGSFPAVYDGALFFGDYARTCIWVMFPDDDGTPDPATRAVFNLGAAHPVDLTVGPGGDLFYADIFGGTVRRIRFMPGNQPPLAMVSATPSNGPVPLTVQLDAGESFDPDGDAVTFAWDLDGDGVHEDASTAALQHTFAAPGAVTVGVRVTDAHDLAATASVIVTAGNSVPSAHIRLPAPTHEWRVGELLEFAGSATDPEQGALPASALRWTIVLHHCPASCHQHPLETIDGVLSGTFAVPDHEWPSSLELRLTVTDAGGLQDTASVLIDPATVTLAFDTTPSGLSLVIGAGSATTPLERTVIVGSPLPVIASAPQIASGAEYLFSSWSDGGAASHVITAPAGPVRYVARYLARCDGPAPATCGNGAVDAPCERCDLGTANCAPGTTCASGCTARCGLVGHCTGSGVPCARASDCPGGQGCCGDAVPDAAEQCDDGNALAGDCCDPQCRSESASTCEPLACEALGPHLTLAEVGRASSRDVDRDGRSERWRTRGTLALHPGTTIEPASEPVTLRFSENGRVLYGATLAPGTLRQRRDLCPRGWKFFDRDADGPGALGWRSGTLRQPRQGAVGCASTVRYVFGSGGMPPMEEPLGRHLRQTIEIGDECATALLGCQAVRTSLMCEAPPR